jgi:hypothetical protein
MNAKMPSTKMVTETGVEIRVGAALKDYLRGLANQPSIVLSIGDRGVQLSIAEARQLSDLLASVALNAATNRG